MGLSAASQIRRFYTTLFRRWGRQHWWPASSRFEVIAGAYLTQNTAWTNVERALGNLRRAGMLSLRGVRKLPLPELEQLIRSAGYFRQKARRMKNFVEYLDSSYGGSLDRMFAEPTAKLRMELLALNGVGPETADSILLYAGNHPVFVVDAYTRRILERHGMAGPKSAYDDIRNLVEKACDRPAFLSQCERHAGALDAGDWRPREQPEGSCHAPSRASTMQRTALAQVYNEMHGLLVGVGKNYCWKTDPQCDKCPLGVFLPAGKRPKPSLTR